MAKVKQRKARKDYPQQGIKRGDMYYQWQLYKGPVMRSKVAPRRSQLTGSGFLATVYDIADVTIPNADSPDDFREAANELETLADETQGSFDNMPEGLQQGTTGQQLEQRVESCNEWKDAINSAADTLETELNEIEEEGLNDEEKAERIAGAVETCRSECEGAEPSWE